MAGLYAGLALMLVGAADTAAGHRLRSVATERSWPWRGQEDPRAEERFARRLGLIDGTGQAMTELLDGESRLALAHEQAVAQADDRLHRMVMLHGTVGCASAVLAIVLGAVGLLAWPGWTRGAAVVTITVALVILAEALAMRLLPEAILAAWS